MQRRLAALLLSAVFLLPVLAGGETSAETNPAFERYETVSVDGFALSVPVPVLLDGISYVPLRKMTDILQPEWEVSWENGQAVVESPAGVRSVFRPGEETFFCNGTPLRLPGPCLAWEGRVFLPVRPLAAILGAEVDWNPETGVMISTLESDKVFWLSRIISAESQGEPLEGQIAVGNVVLNRAASRDFPDTIYSVIFEPEQFEPVRNGTVWNNPVPSSVLAARLSLAGVKAVEQCLYFLAPELTDNHWTMENREYVTTIGVHWFYR